MGLIKKSVDKRLRLGVLALLAALFAASAYGFYCIYRMPAEYQTNVPVYSYSQKGDLTYRVKMKPNSLFPEPYMGPGKTYYAKITEGLLISLSYIYTGDKDAKNIKCAYEVVGIIEEPEMWKKTFVLVPFTEVYGQGKSFSFQKDFTLNLNYYNDFLKALNEEIGMGLKEPKLNIRANIYTKADTAAGEVRGDLSPTMAIPLTTGSYKVDGDLSVSRDGSIDRTVTAPVARLKVLKDRQMLLLIIPLVIGMSFVWFMLKTKSRVFEIDQRQDLINRVNKKYGDRLVEVGEGTLTPIKEAAVELQSMEDLVKVADEIGKPIFVISPGSGTDLPSYYVFDGSTVFRYALSCDSACKVILPREAGVACDH